MKSAELYNLAELNRIDIKFLNIRKKGFVTNINDSYEIWLSIDILKSQLAEKEVLAEELAHCLTGSVYPLSAVATILGRMNIIKSERLASRTAAALLVPLAALKPLLSLPYYEIAEELNVSEKTVITAVEYYQLRGML